MTGNRRHPVDKWEGDWQPRGDRSHGILQNTFKRSAEAETQPLKTPTLKARALLVKLQALADRGIDGEKATAKRKLAQLKAAYDFGLPNAENKDDIFSGRYQAKRGASVTVATIADIEIGNFVKWAIASATGVECMFRGHQLVAEVNPTSARRLKGVAKTIADGFRELWARFAAVPGVDPADRAAFFAGLYDGMMGEVRGQGQPLPGRRGVKPVPKPGKRTVALVPAPGLHVHPYTIAVGLGKQIRFSVPLDTIVGELETLVKGEIAG